MFKGYDISIEDRKNLIIVDGINKTAFEILESYINLIEKDYNLTIEEICNILKVERNYFHKKLSSEFKHIIITKRIRNIAETLQVDNVPSLINKRVLYSREDFNKKICLLMIKKCRAIKVKADILMNKAPFIYSNLNDVQKYFNKINMILRPVYVESKVENINELESIASIRTGFNFNYNVQVYRYVNTKYLSKYILNNSIRYDLMEFDGDIGLIIPYSYISESELNNIDKLLKRVEEEFKNSLVYAEK